MVAAMWRWVRWSKIEPRKRSQQAKTDRKWWSSGAAEPKGKREQETKESEIQDNMLTFSAFFEIHRETRGENYDTEPCNEPGCQPDNKADGRNMLTGRQWMTTVKAILTLLKVNFNKRVSFWMMNKGTRRLYLFIFVYLETERSLFQNRKKSLFPQKGFGWTNVSW